MANQQWGHCKHCKYFGSPAKQPLGEEEARCQEPTLSRFELLVFGASGCNAFELRQGVAETTEQPGLVT